MEPWFIFVVAATFLGGVHVFIQRVGVAKGYSSNLLNSYSGIISGVFGLGVTAITGELATISWALLVFAVVNGFIYLIGSNLRMDAMKYMDTTIMLPLHKFISPLFVLIIGLFFFKELLSLLEWIGILLGMTVPLLLIAKGESERQNNLKKGLIIMTASAAIVAVNAAVNKEGVAIFSSVLLLAALSNAGGGLLSLGFNKLRSRGQAGSNLHLSFDPGLLKLSAICGFVQLASFSTFLYAFAYGGPLAIVYTIHSLYILIPIVLSILFYNEHWSFRKVAAIIVSIAAIGLMG